MSNLLSAHTDPTADIDEMTEIGHDMLACAQRQWFQYDDENAFTWEINAPHLTGTRIISDPSQDARIEVTPLFFFLAHRSLIFLDGLNGYADRSWWEWASSTGPNAENATPDDYDDYTCDFVLQMLLYGEVIYS